MVITSFSTSSYAIHADAFNTSIYIASKFEMPLILPSLDFTEIYCYCYGYCRLLANGMRIFHMECHCSFITDLDGRPQSSYPW